VVPVKERVRSLLLSNDLDKEAIIWRRRERRAQIGYRLCRVLCLEEEVREMFEGLMPAMVTPFDERGELDLGATEAVIERFIEAG
jgi:hypothetical protein